MLKAVLIQCRPEIIGYSIVGKLGFSLIKFAWLNKYRSLYDFPEVGEPLKQAPWARDFASARDLFRFR
jgi:hypothetical protein